MADPPFLHYLCCEFVYVFWPLSDLEGAVVFVSNRLCGLYYDGFSFCFDVDVASFFEFGCFPDVFGNYDSAFFIDFDGGFTHNHSHIMTWCPLI